MTTGGRDAPLPMQGDYCTTIQTTLRYIKRFDIFHVKCLRAILHVKWQDRVSNPEILYRTGLSGVDKSYLLKPNLGDEIISYGRYLALQTGILLLPCLGVRASATRMSSNTL